MSKNKKNKKNRKATVTTPVKQSGRLKRAAKATGSGIVSAVSAVKKATVVSCKTVASTTVSAGSKVKAAASKLKIKRSIVEEVEQVANFVRDAAEKTELLEAELLEAEKTELLEAAATLRRQASAIESIANSM